MRGMIRMVHVIGDDEGAGILETALVSTIFFAVLIGCFQMLLALYTFHFVSDAAREATRYAIVRGSASCTNTPQLTNCDATADQIQTYVRSLSYPGIKPSNLNVTTTWLAASTTNPSSTNSTTWSACAATCNAPGNEVKVVVAYPYSFSVPFVPKATLNLTSTSQMVISQ